MQTKHEEITTTTSVIEEMKGSYTATRLLRSWDEDFADEDTGEVVKIQRNEILFDKGTLIDHDVLSQINFYLQSGDIKEVQISNQQRTGTPVKDAGSVYAVTINHSKKKKTFYLYSNSVELTLKIITDYLEQKILGVFSFHSIKEIGYSNLLPVKEDNEEEEKKDFYKMLIESTFEDNEAFEQTYILKASDAEEAKENIYKFISMQQKKENRERPFEITIISAQKLGLSSIVHYDFSKKYMHESEEKPVEEIEVIE